MKTLHGCAALRFDDGTIYLGVLRLVSCVGEAMVWVGTLQSKDVLAIATKVARAELEFGKARWPIDIIKSNLDGFVTIQTTDTMVEMCDVISD
ncbi:MAG: hypothetical protein R3197_00240 [Paracoccaceae bacterium]|nr:hypothetical protein [Paracoccaceae bacterium]